MEDKNPIVSPSTKDELAKIHEQQKDRGKDINITLPSCTFETRMGNTKVDEGILNLEKKEGKE
jgi:hypothetical protein